jgi:sarcosine oxidase subunit beta
VCVLEKGYIGGGNTGRNTTIIRSNYLTPEGVKFYDESVRCGRTCRTDFDLNLFYANAATSRWPTPIRPCAPCAGVPR